jgi:uncharacterized protein (TIGR02680 family)
MMDTPLFASEPEPHPQRPALPEPRLERWQPLRLGLVELYHYDSEEFWFRDGHLLLRGNNGTGKSKVLSLTLPFLLDAKLTPSRIEPDGDPGKKMSWNLLMGTHDRRMGYAWLELGRVGEDGRPHYLTLGAGLSAAAARAQVDCWYFIIDAAADAPRINADLWLTSEQRVVLTRERLREALQGRGQVYETSRGYRRAVDERLFRLGRQRYDALMDTLIQLRQPQLSKKPDEGALSNALSQALPPLGTELIADVAEALGQLEEDRRQLEEYQALARAVGRFEQRYRVYAGTRGRREAGALRSAQTEFDNASRARNEAEASLAAAAAAEANAKSRCEQAELGLAGERARLETLRADPRNQDANRLENAAQDVQARRRGQETAVASAETGRQRAQREAEECRRLARRTADVEALLGTVRKETATHAGAAGIGTAYAASPLASLGAGALVALAAQTFEQACLELRALAAARRNDIGLVRQRLAAVARADAALAQRREAREERLASLEEAVARRERADAVVESEGQALVDSWDRHFSGLRQLRLGSADCQAVLSAVNEWVCTPSGDNPARRLLQTAQHEHSLRQARRRASLEARARVLEGERSALQDERDRLQCGVDAGPPAPHTRDVGVRAARAGAPLWHVLEFRPSVSASERASIEAGLEVSGLLDAWLSPDGRLQAGDDGSPVLDVQVTERKRCAASLDAWLEAAIPDGCAVPADVVAAVLAGIACAADDPGDCEAWIAPDGRFRLGALAGAWAKPDASYIGFAARAAARARRLAAIDERLAQLASELAAVLDENEQLDKDAIEAAEEWQKAPTDEALLNAHLEAASCAREAQAARDRLAEADARYQEAAQALLSAQQQLTSDAGDLNLPVVEDALAGVETALDEYRDAQSRLCQAASDLRQALPELARQRDREREAFDDLQLCEERLVQARKQVEEAEARLKVLRDSVGAGVDELLRQQAEARAAAEAGEQALKAATEQQAKRGEERAVAAEKARSASDLFERRSSERADAVAHFQRFAATGLLQAAWPEAPLPDMGADWTIDPALTLARRAEQALSGIRHDDEAWGRVQKEVQSDYAELQRALSARGHQAQAESSDWGLIVTVVYQNRPERPDRLALRLGEEIAERSQLLTAKERAVLENHLQTEIAAEIQRLLQVADAQRNAINKELHRRPTSTGVRYRLQWLPLSEEEGAPAGLEAARRRLLNTNADLWTAEDRSIVGAMLQRRIAAERERADGASGPDGGVGSGSLADQLARALDYRRWHRFRVERWQDGSWRRLSGPASSGERALGLTVPLFAAVASFYTQSNYRHAPRLMLLDEAFAGIDDAARAHCMGLIREFDLDFAITSEREWACYAELPGVSICQLQRKEGIDAVYVSRWTWDGRARTREADPDRRFAAQ